MQSLSFSSKAADERERDYIDWAFSILTKDSIERFDRFSLQDTLFKNMTCRAPLPATDSCRTETTTTRTTTPTPTTKRQALRSGSSIGSSRTMRPSPVLLVATIFLLALFQQYTPANATTTLAFQPAAWPVSRGSAPTSTLASAALRSLCARLQAGTLRRLLYGNDNVEEEEEEKRRIVFILAFAHTRSFALLLLALIVESLERIPWP